MEIWKDVKGYEGLYQVSSWGNVKSLERIDNNNHPIKEKIIKFYKTIGGYIQVCLWKNGKVKHFQIHRLVAQAFIPNPYNLPEVNHKDENPLNNCVENLEWCDHNYNINYGTRTEKASETKFKPVLQIDKNTNEVVAEFHSLQEVYRQLGYSMGNISQCCNGKPKYKSAYGYKWEYKKVS